MDSEAEHTSRTLKEWRELRGLSIEELDADLRRLSEDREES